MSKLTDEQRLEFRDRNLRDGCQYLCKIKSLFQHNLLLAETVLSKRDSSLKKCSMFIKKLKCLSENNESTAKEFHTLKLSKYVSEAANAILDNSFKTPQEYSSVLEICTLFNQAYDGFSDNIRLSLMSKLQEGDITKIAKSTDALNQRKIHIRLLGELVVAGIINEPLIVLDELKRLIRPDDCTEITVLPLFTYFLRHLENHFLGNESSIFPHEMTCKYTYFFQSVFKSMCRLLVRLNSKVLALEEKGKYHYENRGDLSEKQTVNLIDVKDQFELMKRNLQPLADILNLSLPELYHSDFGPKIVEGKIMFMDPKMSKSENQSSSWFDSEEDRVFYEDLIPLNELVPSSVLPPRTNDAPESSEIIDAPELDPENVNFSSSKAFDPSNHESSSFVSFLELLKTMHAASMSDKASTDFCFSVKKSNRKLLPDAVMLICWNRADLIPFIGRFLANIKPYFPEIIESICKSLLGQFFFLCKKKDPIRATRAKVCRFIGELTKFRVFSQGAAFSCLKRSLDDFTLYNIDMTCMLLELCGKFLFFQPESHSRIQNIIDIITRKKQSGQIDQNRVFMIENALYLMKPRSSDDYAIDRKEKSNLELFVERLLRRDLNSNSAETIFNILRKLPWDDPVVNSFLSRMFLEVWKVKASSISSMAALLAGIQKIYPEFCAKVLDDLVEEFYLGLEINHPSWSQRRLSVVKMFGELYSFAVVDADIIFTLLFSLLSFGHPEGLARRSLASRIDPPEDQFRIHLICSLLCIVAPYLCSPVWKITFDQFLLGFQYYISSKIPLNLETETFLDETLDSTKIELKFETIEEAVDAMIEASGGVLTFLRDDLDLKREKVSSSSESEEDIVLLQEEFEGMISEAVQDSMESRKLERKPQVFESAIPMSVKSFEQEPKSGLSFKLLLKKKNKIQTKEIQVPVDASLIDHIKKSQAFEIAELEAIRAKTILAHERLQDSDESTIWNDTMLRALKQIPPPTRADFERVRTRKRFYRNLSSKKS